MPIMITPESDFDFLDTDEILNGYPYILESMNEEEYYLENDLCFAFDEIVYENRVVGFATFELHDESVLMLTECYILPEFRGKKLFFNELSKMIFSAPEFGILQPTRNVVELLIDYSYAKKVSDDIVVSAVDFYFDNFDARSDIRDEIEEDIPCSNFYDLSIASTILVCDGEVIYHSLLENDLRKYGMRKELNEDYFKGVREFLLKNQGEFESLIDELKDGLPEEKLGYDIIIGDGEGLSEFMQGLVENEIVSYKKALEIKEQLIREYESGQLTDDSIDERLAVLLLGEMQDSLMSEGFQELLDFPENDDAQLMKEFFEVIGDNEELGADIFNAILSDDEEGFENIIFSAMDSDDEFSNRMMDLIEDLEDDDQLQLPGGEYLDIESLGLNSDSPYPVAEMMWGPNDDKYRLDDTYYGKDYPISHDIYIFRVLKSLKKHNNLEFALLTAGMTGAMTPHAVESELHMRDLINDEVTYDNWDEFANDCLTVSDLKDMLRQNNLKVSGKKQELIDRVAENRIPLSEFKSNKVLVTPNGEEFLRQNPWIDFYDTFLDKFNFNDFVKYLDNNGGDLIDVTIGYLKQHLDLAKKENDLEYIADCSIALEMISLGGEKFLKKLQ